VKSDTQKATIQEKRNVLIRQIGRWRQVQLVYMPGAVAQPFPTHTTEADDNDNDPGDLELPERIPLVLPSAVQSTMRNATCLHRVTEYEQQLRLAQLQDSLVELRRVRRIRHSLLMNHQTQIAGQGQRVNTRSRTVITGIEDRITKFAQRYRAAYHALLQLDPAGEWQETYLELKEEDNRGPGKEDYEQGLGDGTYTFSWIWLLNPRARDGSESEVGSGEVGASDEDVNDTMRVQWATSHARMERWAEEVELLQEEMRRVVAFLEWKSGHWLEKQDTRSTTAAPSIQSGLQAYARKQAAIHHDLAVSFSKLWHQTLVSQDLEHSWLTKFMEEHEIPLTDMDAPTARRRGISKTSVANEINGGQLATATPITPSQDRSGFITGDTPIPLEEAHFAEGDDDEDDDSVDWDTSDSSGSDDNGYEDDDSDYFDFD